MLTRMCNAYSRLAYTRLGVFQNAPPKGGLFFKTPLHGYREYYASDPVSASAGGSLLKVSLPSLASI